MKEQPWWRALLRVIIKRARAAVAAVAKEPPVPISFQMQREVLGLRTDRTFQAGLQFGSSRK